MYLKHIDIVGFKSFADKTRIDLKPGITGIVGPNGCGKSNIMEAFRWCIGEMSWKSLRSDSMVSVIFAGTARRNPMNLAEVTLTFDNASKLLPLQYSEVSVTRRIYRSGESEYFLNKTQCRLRDIRELFLDTGIGNAGYAIIDQGGVDFVLKSKPEERRALFEEAAGVSKYKAKRQEALRKLDRVEIDLGRLQDSVTLINEQTKKLDSDARKAKLFQKYRSELASVEAGQIIQEIGAIDKDLESENERLAPVSRRLEELQTAVEADEARHAALNLERTSQETAVIESNQKLAQAKSEIGRLEERIDNAKSTVQELESQLNNSREEIEREAERAVAINPEIGRARREFGEAQGAFEKAKGEVDAFAADFKKLEDERAAAAEERAGLRRELLAAAEAIQESGRRLSAGESRVGQLDFEVRRTLKELEKKLEKIEAIRGEAAERQEAALAQRSRSDEARSAVVAVETTLSEIRAELAGISEDTLQRHGEKARIQAQIEALEAHRQRDPYWVGAHAVVNAGLSGVIGTVRSLLEVDEAQRAAVEDLLGERLYAVVCRDSAAAKAGIDFLKNAGRGRARFLVLSSLPEGTADAAAPSEARPVIDSVRFDPAHERVVQYLLGGAYSTEDGIYGRHWICGGSAADAGAPLKLSDIEDLKKKLADSEASLAELGRRKGARAAALESAESELRTARGRLSEIERETHRLDAEYNQRAETLAASEEEISIIEGEAARGLREMAETQETIIESRTVLEEKRASEGGLKAREAAAEKRLAAFSEAVAAKRVEKEHLEKSLSNYESQRSVMKSSLDRMLSDKEALERSIGRRKEQQSQWDNRIRELGEVDVESKRSLESLHSRLAGFENEAKALFDKLQALQRETQDREESLRVRKVELEDLRGQLHEAEIKLSNLKTRREFLTARLVDEWELSYEDAKEKYNAVEADQDRIQFLRRRIAALGNINMAAPEEYEELTKKRDHLQGQIDDLSSAKKDLHSVISKINATTRENFRQTFTEVRENFRKLYGILFEGGESDLVLTDKDNLLETGVDIVAQPPGKRLQSISQLSGGEKTLTAIALLFSFFMVRSSPVCMLDEADAALDDANIERFVSLLREFGDKTQFLIVSHNKATMESCDAIYGVTMEESGVSQLISVDFKKRKAAVAKLVAEAAVSSPETAPEKKPDPDDEPDAVSA